MIGNNAVKKNNMEKKSIFQNLQLHLRCLIKYFKNILTLPMSPYLMDACFDFIFACIFAHIFTR